MTVPPPDRPVPDSGDRPPETVARRLAEPPSARYPQARQGPDRPTGVETRMTSGPILQALAVAIGGAALLFLVSGILSTTVGLLFIAAVMGAGVGLTLAGLAVAAPSESTAASAPLPRSTIRRAAVVLAIGAVAFAAIATWLFAQSEGGALGLFDYLWSTFGLLVPTEIVVAALGAAWGSGAGPIRTG
ncbi:MAG TPA: hypothetical protein VEX41_11050 [Candidatus Eisenbacteria bacterium]|nr:hypothetical protein [Candidatus Eisenbacteria bacterium]